MHSRPSSRFRSVKAACALLVAFGSLLVPAQRSEAAGITTHGWMALEAIDHVTDPALRALLVAHADQVRAGAGFPDVGYLLDNTYGEEAHWQRFSDAYIDRIAAKDGCGDLTDPNGPCAELIAHAFGVSAHGMGDEVWDWLFEPYSPDLGEYSTVVPTSSEGGAETQMDLVAIGRYGVPRPVAKGLPDVDLLLEVFADTGFGVVDPAEFAYVPMLPVAWDAERDWADTYLAEVEAAMPWMSANLVTAPGGIDFAAVAIAGYWTAQWGRLLGDQPATTVSITHPGDGQTGIPATGWDRPNFSPGSSRSGGGAVTRITAVLTSARPYAALDGQPSPPRELPDGGMTITRVADGAAVALRSGYPRSVPYGGSAGQHLIDVQPDANLDRCTWYRVDVGVTTVVTDARGEPVTPYSWSFRTECDTEPPEATTSTTTPTSPTAPTTVTTPASADPGSQSDPDVAPVRSAVADPVRAEPTYAG